uniref:Uncharacterized protein n=1 Tax=Strongyloides stercoralis TaxID=6248 RepID=A0AAF5CZY4_STRER
MSAERINKIEEIKAKVMEMKDNSLPWIESMDVSVPRDELTLEDIDDDFKREMVFYNQAVAGAQIAINKLKKLNIPVFRPPDYLAEMAKSKEHMDKVKNRLDEIKKQEDLQKTIRRLREEKKFAAKIQKKRKMEQMIEKHKEKKEMDKLKRKSLKFIIYISMSLCNNSINTCIKFSPFIPDLDKSKIVAIHNSYLHLNGDIEYEVEVTGESRMVWVHRRDLIGTEVLNNFEIYERRKRRGSTYYGSGKKIPKTHKNKNLNRTGIIKGDCSRSLSLSNSPTRRSSKRKSENIKSVREAEVKFIDELDQAEFFDASDCILEHEGNSFTTLSNCIQKKNKCSIREKKLAFTFMSLESDITSDLDNTSQEMSTSSEYSENCNVQLLSDGIKSTSIINLPYKSDNFFKKMKKRIGKVFEQSTVYDDNIEIKNDKDFYKKDTIRSEKEVSDEEEVIKVVIDVDKENNIIEPSIDVSKENEFVITKENVTEEVDVNEEELYIPRKKLDNKKERTLSMGRYLELSLYEYMISEKNLLNCPPYKNESLEEEISRTSNKVSIKSDDNELLQYPLRSLERFLTLRKKSVGKKLTNFEESIEDNKENNDMQYVFLNSKVNKENSTCMEIARKKSNFNCMERNIYNIINEGRFFSRCFKYSFEYKKFDVFTDKLIDHRIVNNFTYSEDILARIIISSTKHAIKEINSIEDFKIAMGTFRNQIVII